MLTLASKTSNNDWLFDRISSGSEGWGVPIQGILTHVPLADIDYFAISTLTDVIRKKARTALALPRLESGIGLSLATYLELNRFFGQHALFAHARPLFEHFKGINIRPGQRIVVITLDRTLRDYLYLSSMRFRGSLYPFSSFPLARISPTGEEVLLDTRKSVNFYDLPPIVFYHLGHVEKYPEDIKNAIVLVELPNSTSRETLGRLTNFIDATKPESVLALTNSFAQNQKSMLQNSGFEIIQMGPKLLTGTRLSAQKLPSFSASLSAVPSQVVLRTSLVNANSLDKFVYRISTALKNIRLNLQGDIPEIISLANGLLSTMKNLAVPLQDFEDARKLTPYIGTVKSQLNKLFANPYLNLNERQAAAIRPIWDAVGADFFNLYDSLIVANPKFTELMAQLDEKSTNSNSAILFYDETSANIFKEILKSKSIGEQNIEISTLKSALRSKMRKTDIILTGAWSSSSAPMVAAQLAKEITILTYNAELFGVESHVTQINASARSSAQLEPLLQNSPGAEDEAWLEFSQDSKDLLSNKKAWTHEEDDPFGAEDFSLYYSGEVWESSGGEETDILEDDYVEEDERVGFLLLLDDDRLVALPADREVLVFSNGNMNGRSISPEFLQEGDIILALDKEHNKEVYEELLERAEDLSGADANITTEWALCMKKIRLMRQETEISILIAALRLLKCERTEPTMRSWLQGTTMAPSEVNDIEKLLRLAMHRHDESFANKVSVEIEKVRIFHRKLGKKLHRRISKQAQEHNSNDTIEDIALNEILDLTSPVKIASIDGPLTVSFSDIPELLVLR